MKCSTVLQTRHAGENCEQVLQYVTILPMILHAPICALAWKYRSIVKNDVER